MEHLMKQDDKDTCHRHQVQHEAVGLKQPLGIDDPVSECGSDEAADRSHHNGDRGPAEKIQDILF